MQSRKSLLELFSTFMQFEDDQFSRWATDWKLRRNMNRCQEQLGAESEFSENFWVIYWCKRWQAQGTDLERGHLAAYLQEVCYWSSRKTIASFSIAQYTLSDCFQVAISRVDKVLKGFNPDYGRELKTYASVSFGSILRDFLKQRSVIDICSDWSLLRKLSQKRLISALQNAGLPPERISAYVLAWQCLKQVQVPSQPSSTRSLPKPDDTVWQTVARLYNSDRLSQSPPAPEGNPAALEKWMHDCVKAARSYLYPTTTSINAPRAGQETGELVDTLVGDTKDSLLNELIVAEEQQTRQSQQTQINQILKTSLATLDPSVQQLLELYYAQGLTQQEMAKRLDMKQYTISRRFSKAREVLLLALTEWSRDVLHITPSPDVLKGISALLEEWLTTHYHHPDLSFSQTSGYDT